MKAAEETILVVDDEKALAEGLKYNLEVEGYKVRLAFSGEEGITEIRKGNVSLMLLDIMMPGINGLKVLETLREEGDRTPVILLTAKGQPEDKVTGLEIGADDYVTKPFGVAELMARIRAVLRRAHPEDEPVAEIFKFDALTIDFRRYVVIRNETEYPLSRFESEILRYLVAHQDEVVTRRDLLTKVWGYVNLPTTRTVDNHIARLRKKVEEEPDSPKHILTIHGIGYRFVTGREEAQA